MPGEGAVVNAIERLKRRPGRDDRERPARGDAHLDGLADDDVAIAASRDPAAFAVLYERYVDAIYRYAFRRLGTRDLAEDATSVIFTRALAAIRRYQPRGSFRSWLFAIAHNVVTDQFRGKRREIPLPNHVDFVDRAPSPEDQAIAADERRTIHSLLEHLTPDQRNLVELRLAGLASDEIQLVLGRSRSWVHTTQHRAIKRLQVVLGIDHIAGGDDLNG